MRMKSLVIIDLYMYQKRYASCNFMIITPLTLIFLPDNSATQLVLKAHKEAVNSLSGSGSAQLGTVATVVAAANSTAQEALKEVEAAMKITLKNALGSMSSKSSDGQMDDSTIMKVKIQSSC